MRTVLNIGGGPAHIAIPGRYDHWRKERLDIDPACAPEILLDARELKSLPAGRYDAVYCSHNLEHYHRHDAEKVVHGFAHVLKPDGYAEIYVPDMEALFQIVVEQNLDIDDFLYQSPRGPILVRDVVYGYHVEIEQTGNDFYSHKTGFTPKSLRSLFVNRGFPIAIVAKQPPLALVGMFFKQPPTPDQMQALNIKVRAISADDAANSNQSP